MLCQDKMALKTSTPCYIVYICISICQYFISVLYQYVYFFSIVVYTEVKIFNYHCEKRFIKQEFESKYISFYDL